MKQEKKQNAELEKYLANLQELEDLHKQLEQRLSANKSMSEFLKQQGKSNKFLLEETLISLDSLKKTNERRAKFYTIVINLATTFTVAVIANVIVDSLSSGATGISYTVIVTTGIIGFGVLIAFGYKSWLDYSAQKNIDATKKILQSIENQKQ